MQKSVPDNIMKISTRGRYALRIMIDLAENSNGEYVAMKEIAERQNVSLKYMEKILPPLVKNNLIAGVHGKGGGYKLTKAPSEYTIFEIIYAAEGELAPVSCLEDGAAPCEHASNCRTLPLWVELNEVVNSFLSNKKLSEYTKK